MTRQSAQPIKGPSTIFHRQSITYKSGRFENEEYEDSADGLLVKVLSKCDNSGKFPRFEVECFMGEHQYGPGRVTKVTYVSYGKAEVSRQFEIPFKEYLARGSPKTLKEDTYYTPIFEGEKRR